MHQHVLEHTVTWVTVSSMGSVENLVNFCLVDFKQHVRNRPVKIDSGGQKKESREFKLLCFLIYYIYFLKYL